MQIKKRGRRESIDSLKAIIDAAKKPSNLDAATIYQRNEVLDKKLNDDHLTTVDVVGDGNCFYRSISYGLHRNQLSHSELRQNIAQHLLTNYAKIFKTTVDCKDDYDVISKCVNDMKTDCVWAGEESIIAAADFLCREIRVYKFSTSLHKIPIVYSPCSDLNFSPALRIAYYEPGHYRCVVGKSSNDLCQADFLLNQDVFFNAQSIDSSAHINNKTTTDVHSNWQRPPSELFEL